MGTTQHQTQQRKTRLATLLPTGVRPTRDGKRIEINIIWKGVAKSAHGRMYEVVRHSPTQANLTWWGEIRKEAQALIQNDHMDAHTYLSYFPDTPHKTRLPVTQKDMGIPLFSEVCQEYISWLRTGASPDTTMRRELVEIEPDTIQTYDNILKAKWIKAFWSLDITEIHSDLIEEVLCEGIEAGRKAKTINNWLIPLRGVMRLARKKYKAILKYNPVIDIENQRLKKNQEIDPYNNREKDAILAWLRMNQHPMIYAYYLFAFNSGVRCPSEILGLDIEQVDYYGEPAAFVRICQRVSHRRQQEGGEFTRSTYLKEGTKTNDSRDVFLHDEMKDAIEIAMAYNSMKSGQIFRDPLKPLEDDSLGETHRADSFTDAFKAAVTTLGIRYRRPYNTRHTCATQMLMSGMNHQLVADQLGTSVQMLENNYSKWLHGEETMRAMRRYESYKNEDRKIIPIRKNK